MCLLSMSLKKTLAEAKKYRQEHLGKGPKRVNLPPLLSSYLGKTDLQNLGEGEWICSFFCNFNRF